MSFDLIEKYRIGTVSSIFYIPNFITIDEERVLMSNIYAPNQKWTQLQNRRLINVGGMPHEKGMLQQPLPEYLVALNSKIVKECGVFPKAPNHVLINEYKSGQGIMSHSDGPIYEPIVASVSIGSSVLIEFTKKGDDEVKIPVLLAPRSLIIFADDMYKEYLHGIKENSSFIVPNDVINEKDQIGQTIERELRVSLTIRVVKKTIKKLF